MQAIYLVVTIFGFLSLKRRGILFWGGWVSGYPASPRSMHKNRALFSLFLSLSLFSPLGFLFLLCIDNSSGALPSLNPGAAP